jgi:hypothetical protein
VLAEPRVPASARRTYAEITDRLLTIGSHRRQLANPANGQTLAIAQIRASGSGRVVARVPRILPGHPIAAPTRCPAAPCAGRLQPTPRSADRRLSHREQRRACLYAVLRLVAEPHLEARFRASWRAGALRARAALPHARNGAASTHAPRVSELTRCGAGAGRPPRSTSRLPLGRVHSQRSERRCAGTRTGS